jgi:hypothetical protein
LRRIHGNLILIEITLEDDEMKTSFKAQVDEMDEKTSNLASMHEKLKHEFLMDICL